MSRRKKIGLAVAIIAIILVAIIVVTTRLFSGSSEGTVHVGTPESTGTSATQPVAVKTPLFSAVLPAGFSVKRQAYDTTADPQLQFEANTPSSIDQQVAISAGPLPSSGIKGLGDYNLRATEATTYGPFAPSALPNGAVAFRTLAGPTEFTVFWAHGNRYYEVSLSTDGVAAIGQLDTVFTRLMAEWHYL